jgi:hypothetical protein
MMRTLFAAALGDHIAAPVAGLFGGSPLARLASAGLAARLAMASLPLALLIAGGLAAWQHYGKGDTPRSKPRAAPRPGKGAKRTKGSNPAVG